MEKRGVDLSDVGYHHPDDYAIDHGSNHKRCPSQLCLLPRDSTESASPLSWQASYEHWQASYDDLR